MRGLRGAGGPRQAGEGAAPPPPPPRAAARTLPHLGAADGRREVLGEVLPLLRAGGEARPGPGLLQVEGRVVQAEVVAWAGARAQVQGAEGVGTLEQGTLVCFSGQERLQGTQPFRRH